MPPGRQHQLQVGEQDQAEPVSLAQGVAKLSMVGLSVMMGVQVLGAGAEVAVIDTAPPMLDLDATIAFPLADPEEKLSSDDLAAREEGVVELVGGASEEWPADHRRAFLTELAPVALESAISRCLPASVTLGQAALESGWGRSGLATKHRNLFGIKAGRAAGVTMETTEVENGRGRRVQARFRTFDAWAESVAMHDDLLDLDVRYSDARGYWRHWPAFLEEIAPVYASDPNYVGHVSSLVDRYRLDRWDEVAYKIARRRGAPCPEGPPSL